MTEGPHEPAVAAAAPVANASLARGTARASRLASACNWFWRGRELAALGNLGRPDSPRVRQLAARSRLLFALGERALRPGEPLPYPGREAAAAELFREATYWAVRAVAARSEPATDASKDPWSALGDTLPGELGASQERFAQSMRLVEAGSFTELWELSDEESALRASDLAGLARQLLDRLTWQARARDALLVQRLVRLAVLAGVIIAAISGVVWLAERAEQSRVLSTGKPWRTSSAAGGLGCPSPSQRCGDHTDFFFHTSEEQSPWFELDLGQITAFTAVDVDNRRDCCRERAAPLILEVSNDQQHFRELARRTTSFKSWHASFGRTEARYVRLRVARPTNLHLARVRVLR